MGVMDVYVGIVWKLVMLTLFSLCLALLLVGVSCVSLDGDRVGITFDLGRGEERQSRSLLVTIVCDQCCQGKQQSGRVKPVGSGIFHTSLQQSSTDFS